MSEPYRQESRAQQWQRVIVHEFFGYLWEIECAFGPEKVRGLFFKASPEPDTPGCA